jgi:hypothetical protein
MLRNRVPHRQSQACETSEECHKRVAPIHCL